jgi:hypothetical protein
VLAHGFPIEMLDALVRDGLATATPETVHAGKRPIKAVTGLTSTTTRTVIIEAANDDQASTTPTAR